MKILVAYATKSGGTREMAELLLKHIPNHTVTLADVSEVTPNPAEFDYAVLGGPIRINRIHAALKKYIKAHEAALAAMPHSLFLCCAFGEQFEHYLGVAFPKSLLETAEETVYFGGELNPARQKGLDKLLTKMLRNGILESEEDELALPGLLPEHVRLLADRLRLKSL